jgi:sugar lactone lactonase YvrE
VTRHGEYEKDGAPEVEAQTQAREEKGNIQSMFNFLRPLGVAVVLSVMLVPPAMAAEEKPAYPIAQQTKSKLPDYPRVDLATVYEVDPTWPQRPADCEAGQTPGVAVDKDDNVYVFVRANPPVQVYSADGKFLRAWGKDFIGSAHHIKIDHEGNVWIADVKLNVVRKCTPDGKVLLTLGTEGERGIDEKHLNMPTDMAISPSGDIFVSDGYGNARVVHFDKTGKFIKAWGSMGVKRLQFSIPHAIVMDSKGRLYVADRNNNRVQVYSQDGELLDSWKDILVPWGFCITPKDELWICGSSPMPWVNDPKYPNYPLGCPPKDQLFMRFDPTGKVTQLWTVPKAEDGKEKPGDLNWVHCIAVDSKGNIYAGDIQGKRVQKFVRKAGETAEE